MQAITIPPMVLGIPWFYKSKPEKEQSHAVKKKVIAKPVCPVPAAVEKAKGPKGLKFTEEQDEFIRKNFKTLPSRAIGKHLGICAYSVCKRIHELGLRKKKQRYW